MNEKRTGFWLLFKLKLVRKHVDLYIVKKKDWLSLLPNPNGSLLEQLSRHTVYKTV
jgi:hypothetical protein